MSALPAQVPSLDSRAVLLMCSSWGADLKLLLKQCLSIMLVITERSDILVVMEVRWEDWNPL